MKLDQAPPVGPITTDRRLLLDCARAIQEAIGMEEGLDHAAGETVLDRIQKALGMTDEEMSEATGPWVMSDDFCPACVGTGRGSVKDPGVSCSSCGGSRRLTLGPLGPY